MEPLARVLVFAGTFALSILAVIAITGGFTIDVGPLHLSAHRIVAPLAVAAVAYAGALIAGRDRFRDAAGALLTRLATHGTAIAFVLGAATAGIGVAFGTYAASGADAGGYMSQAVLIADGQLSFREPLVERATWPDAAWSFAPLGFRPGRDPAEIVPTYPPGLPIAMLLASAVAGEFGPFLVAPLLGAIGVVATYRLGVRIHSRTAGVVAAALMATSPVWLFQIVQPMSDVPATALWTIALLGAVSGAPLISGVASGASLLMRPNLFPLVFAIAFVLVSTPDRSRDPSTMRRRWYGLFAFGTCVVLAGAIIAAVQWRLYGNPLSSGHGSLAELFSIANIVPNIRDYLIRLLRGETPALVMTATAVAILLLTRRRTTPTAVGQALKLLALTIVPLLVCYLPYGVFPDWSYLRFLLPAFPAAFVVSSALVVEASDRLPHAIRGPVVVVALAAVCAANVSIARREAAFDLRVYESRYRTAGRYLDIVLPREAVIVTSQESASAHYYTGRPVLRWDLLSGDLDRVVAAVRGLGRTPVLLIEDWEEPLLRARFPASALARLDWRSRALFGTTTRVRYLDPADREDSHAPGPQQPVVQDRVP